MYDSHLHTNNSPDSAQSIDELCISAIKRGLSAVSICDHADLSLFHMYDFLEGLKGSVKDIKRAQKDYGDRIKILQGIEFADFSWNDAAIDDFLSLTEYDIILGSVHRVNCSGHNDSFSRVNMADTPKELLHKFLCIYFDDVIKMIKGYDFDVLSHLTVPLRYVNGKYKRNISISPYTDKIEEILSLIIKKDIALEVNTSAIGTGLNSFFPDEKIIKLYKKMGGKLLTIGSDAHTSERVGKGLTEAKQMLLSLGFSSYHYYEKRKPFEVSITIS